MNHSNLWILLKLIITYSPIRIQALMIESGYLSSVGSEDSLGSYLSRSAVQKIPTPFGVGIFLTGSYLSSQAASSQVLSTYKGLTTVFGMGTGGSSPSSTPTMELWKTHPQNWTTRLLTKTALLGQALDRLVHAGLTCRHAYTLCLSTL